MLDRILAQLDFCVSEKTIGVLGLAFKPETDDMRDSPALDIIPALVSEGANIVAYDPAAMQEAKMLLPDTVIFAPDLEACIKGVDACVIITEWNEFRAITANKFLELMNGDVVVDLRNVYLPSEMRDAGIKYSSIGRF